MRFFSCLLVVLFFVLGCGSGSDSPQGPTGEDPPVDVDGYWVAPDGSDTSGDGSSDLPWATLQHALATVPAAGDLTVTLRDGSYDGATEVTRGFQAPVQVRSENPYGATLRNPQDNATVLFVSHQGPVHLLLEGLVFSNEGTTAGPCSAPAGHLIHLTNVTHITFRNNLVLGNDRMPRCNETIKINLDNATWFPEEIRFEGNFFSTPPAVEGREMIDVFEPGELAIVGNIFVSDRETTGGDGFIHLWGEWGDEPHAEPRYDISRNVFLNYEGSSAKGFVVFGGEGTGLHEISDARIENNLFVDVSGDPMLAPIVMEGVRNIDVRANTFVGDFVASGFVLALGASGSNPPSSDVRVTDNLCWDPTGTMSELGVATGELTLESIFFTNNTVWNEGAAVPREGTLSVARDPDLDERDPQLPGDPSGVAPPRWDPQQRRFASGSTSIAEEFGRIVRDFAAIASTSPARDAAPASRMPSVDILGMPRDASPDVGAFEVR